MFIFYCVFIVCYLVSIILDGALGSQYLSCPDLWFPNCVLFVANKVLRVSKGSWVFKSYF